MREVIDVIFSTWKSYWNGSWYPYLLAGAVLFILICLFLNGQHSRKKQKKFGQDPEKDNGKSEIEKEKSDLQEKSAIRINLQTGNADGRTDIENGIVNKEQSDGCEEDADRVCTKVKAGAVATYTLLALAAFFFPVSAWILQKCIGAEVYWRVLWAVPVVQLLAYVGTRLVRMPKKRIAQTAVLIIMLGVTAFSGKSIYEGNYSRVHNYQQVPDEVAHVCNLINAHRGDGDALLATDNNLSPYIRVYDASIRMPYGRLGRGARAEIDRTVYHDINFESDKYAEIAKNAKHRGCTYLAICIYNGAQQSEIEAEGYVLLDFVNQYGVFALEETEE